MRAIPLLALLSLAAAPAAAQGIVIPVRCVGECPADVRLLRTLSLDTVLAWANVRHGHATTYVRHHIRNDSPLAVAAAFFFPLPADAVITSITVYDGTRVEQYNDWSGPRESRWIAEGIARDRQDAWLDAYAGMTLVHAPVVSIPAYGRRMLQIHYTQPVRVEDGVHVYRYPLSAGAGVAPIGHLTVGATVWAESGFRDLQSPSHAIDVEWGSEIGPCPPRAACGSMSVPSRREKVVRFTAGARDRARDFELRYTVEDTAAERRSASLP